MIRNDQAANLKQPTSSSDSTRLRALSESQPIKLSTEPTKPSSEPRMPRPAEEAEEQVEKQVASIRFKHFLDLFKNRRRTTPKQLGRLLGIATNTAANI